MSPRRHDFPFCAAMALATASFAAEPPAVAVPLPAPVAVPPTELNVRPTEITGAPALKSAARDKVVELPPMIISETSTANPWLYVEVGGTEYLSRCSPSTTRAFVTAQLEIRQMLRVFIPPDLLATNAAPSVSLLVPLETGRAIDDAVTRDMLRAAKQSARERSAEPARKGEPGRKGKARDESAAPLRFLPNMRLDDRDMIAVFTFINERDFQRESLIAAPEFVYVRLVRRTPTLPAWLIEGVSRLYPQSNFRGDPITMRPVRWLSAEDTAGLVRDGESRRVLLAASDLFAVDALVGTENQHPTRVAAWQQQAALFVRWALDPAQAPAAESLWKFARRISVEPATEAIFAECFGFGYADLQERLSDYLPTAVKQPARIVPGRLPALPKFEVKPATPVQVARLRGEWERLEIPFVRRQHPEFLPKYIEQAQTTLRRAVGRGERDPRLLAAAGLCELDAGDASAARPYLEQAAAQRVVRPRVHYEVARLRWADLLRSVPENAGFTVAELQPVLEPLRVAATQAPPLPEVFMLMADAWLRCRERVPASDLPALVEATRQFWRIPGVALRVALVQTREGRRTEALQLLRTSIAFTADPTTRRQLEELHAALSAPEKSAGAK